MRRALKPLGWALLGAGTTLALVLWALGAYAPHQLEIIGPSHPASASAFVREGATSSASPASPLRYRVILIGDAGLSPDQNAPMLSLLREMAAEHPDRSATVFLGDNVYPRGFDGAERQEARRRLGAQLDAAGARAIVVPGNHDWGGGREGPARIREEARFVNAREGAQMAPREPGCPGPDVISLPEGEGTSAALHLVALDTQWLLSPAERERCGTSQHDLMLRLGGLRESLADAPVVVVAHHPIRTAGVHGGFDRGLARRIFFPLTGSSGTLGMPLYRAAMDDLHAALTRLRPLAYVAGHDHSLQVFEGDEAARYYLVSGAGATGKVTRVTHQDDSLFAHAHGGLMTLDVHGDPDAPDDPAEVWLRVIELGKGEVARFRLETEQPPRDTNGQGAAE